MSEEQKRDLPPAAQRALAEAVNISLGRLNALMRTATEAGLIKITQSDNADKRKRVAYEITPRGGSEKNRLTDAFLKRKFAEYDALHAELTGTTLGFSPFNHRTKLMQNNLILVVVIALMYASFRFVMAFGLWHRLRWTEWFAFISGSLYIPFEIYALYHQLNVINVSILLFNLAIVSYLYWVLRRGLGSKA